MITSRPPQPPVMRLIQERRERLGMSKRAAAAFAGISEGRWRQMEAGGREIRGIWIAEDATDRVLAHMAAAVRVAPDDIGPFSPLAAQMLADLIAEREANSGRDAEDAARMMDALGGRGLSARDRETLEAEIADSLRRLRNT